MTKITFENLPSTNTPLSAENLNQMQDNIESGITDAVNTGISGDLVVNSIRTKNMFDGIIEQGSFLPDSGVPTSSTARIRSASFTNVKAGNYTISLYNNNNFDVVVYVYDINGTFKSSESIIGWQSLPYTINIQGERKIKIAIRNKNNSTIVPSDVQNVQIEEGNTATTFSLYQNLNPDTNYIYTTLTPIDTTAFSGTIILRKYGKVVSLEISSFTINNLSANTWKDVVNIPDEYLPVSGYEVRGIGLCDLQGINAIINTSKKLVINSRSNAISTKGLYLNMTWITN